jgi:hypothetical protein
MRTATNAPKWAHAEWNLLLAWLILIPLSQSIVDAVGGTLVKIPSNTTLSYPQYFLLAAIRGASIGLGQWLVLWVWHFRALSWIVVTAVGWAIGAVIAIAIAPIFGFAFILRTALILTCPGTVAAIGQWFLLRQSVRHAALWVVANMGAWLFGSALVLASNYRIAPDLAAWIAWAIVAAELIWLLRHPLADSAGLESMKPEVT